MENLKPKAFPTGTSSGKSRLINRRSMALALTSLMLISSCKKIEPEQQPQIIDSDKSLSPPQTLAVGDNIWYDKFVTYETASGGAYFNNPNAAILGWSESYMLRSYVVMYELTKDTNWLTKLTTHADAVISHATDLGGDGYLDWGTANYGNGGTYPYLVFDGLIAYPIAQFIRLVHQNPSTLSSFSTKANTYRTFIENNIVPKWSNSSSYMGNCWVQLSSSTGYFREPFTFDSFTTSTVFNPLPYNMMAPFALMLWTMYDVNGNTSYRDRANAIVQYFKNGLATKGNGYTWKYCNIANPHIEDTSHGNLDVDMAIESYNRGGTITGTVIAGISNTYTGAMWNQNLTAPKVKDDVEGIGTTYSDTKLLTGWTRLTQFNAKAWTIAAEQFRSSVIGNFNHAHTMTQIMAWDPVKVHNQGFEYKMFNDATLPARWIRSGGTSSNIRLTTAEKSSGAMSVAITSATGDGVWQALYQEWKEWKPNTTYQVTFDVKTVGTNGARIFMHNQTAGTPLSAVHTYNSANWSTQTFTFTTPAATGPELRLHLQNKDLSTAGTAYFDNVVIKIPTAAF